MRSSLIVLAISAASIGASACGGTTKHISSASSNSSGAASTSVPQTSSATTQIPSSSTPQKPPKKPPNKDSNDGDNDPNSNDDNAILNYGHAASEADKRAITTLVKHYYAAAAASDGASGCALIYGLIAETIPEEYAGSLAGKTCAVVVSKLFGQRHKQLVADSAVLQVTRVRVKDMKAYAMLAVGQTPEPAITLHREGRAWKIESLFESGLP